MAPTQLQIKVNALKRLIKEKKFYDQEVGEHEQYVNKLKSNGADEYELKKQIQVLEESKRMIPEINKKIHEHRKALEKFLTSYKGEEDLKEANELIA
ncbi:uncharacterized protein PRCAT00002951001 [Priceomyces carsonii]|uniref:uncharacterized protein n=1 Tax=Priceomyces carsonii TaxID=28549 RepID=UPI002EDB36FB|nr:unnamed protein product [Priceomyces carsonii]